MAVIGLTLHMPRHTHSSHLCHYLESWMKAAAELLVGLHTRGRRDDFLNKVSFIPSNL